jgi:hypothetical protein
MPTTTTAAATHRTIRVEAFEASEAGALAGHAAICSCGYRMATSLSAREAARLGAEHAEYMNRRAARR